MNTIHDAIQYLESLADPAALQGMDRFGMATVNWLGIKMPVLRVQAKSIGKDHALALQLWDTGIADARIVAGLVADPRALTEEQAEAWVYGLDLWDVCDQLCMNLLKRTPFALKKIHDWAGREQEFVKRTGERNFVKKAVNLALRNIGKRNRCLNEQAIRTAERIGQMDSGLVRWISSDALRELRDEKIQARLLG